jgi:predicted nucleic acid-binding protein
MMLYLDTSALVKLYVTESESALVQAWVGEARVLFTAAITYAEARAALAQARRSGILAPTDLRRAVMELDSAWAGYNTVEINEPLVLRAGRLAEAHGLRGDDAVQLAAALQVGAGEEGYRFAAFDPRLNEAAMREGLRLAGPPDLVGGRAASGYGARSRTPDHLRVAASGPNR